MTDINDTPRGTTPLRWVMIIGLVLVAFFGAYRFASARTAQAAKVAGQPSRLRLRDRRVDRRAARRSPPQATPACACCGSGGAPTENGVTGPTTEGAAVVEGDVQKISVDVTHRVQPQHHQAQGRRSCRDHLQPGPGLHAGRAVGRPRLLRGPLGGPQDREVSRTCSPARTRSRAGCRWSSARSSSSRCEKMNPRHSHIRGGDHMSERSRHHDRQTEDRGHALPLVRAGTLGVASRHRRRRRRGRRAPRSAS